MKENKEQKEDRNSDFESLGLLYTKTTKIGLIPLGLNLTTTISAGNSFSALF
jgi:hypothetical protein